MKVTSGITCLLIVSMTGCAAAKKTGDVAIGATAWLADAMIDGLSDDAETPIEQHDREKNERRWRQAWQDNPDVNPAMTAAFKDDYE